MRAPEPIRLFHFTHILNLPSILVGGLRSDSRCRHEGLTEVEIGSVGIRERRLRHPVAGAGPGGCVGDYVPWYFGPRSPMMFTLERNNYEYQGGFENVIYLLSTVPRVIQLGGRWVASDRNAALALAEFTDDEASLVEHISWEVIAAQYWTDFADGADLRAAEFLVFDHVPWEAVESIATRTEQVRDQVRDLVADLEHAPPVSVRSRWYF